MLNKEKLNNLAGELWKGAKKLRGKFKAYEYQAVILPVIMIRRIECMLIQRRDEIEADLKKAFPNISKEEIQKKLKAREILTVSFYNKSDWTLSKILKEDITQIETHFREYLKEFSPIINEIIDEFNYHETISKIVRANRLYSIIDLVAKEDFSTQRLSNIEMGYVYEELLQRFTQDDAKDTGEHFTPREIIRIMVELVEIDFNPKSSQRSISIYDPACGTGGMLSTAKEHLPVYGGNGLRGYFSNYNHEGNFVLIGRQGALCGNINYASGKFWASEHAVVATPIKKISSIWLGEILRTMNLNQYSNSAAQPGLSVEKIKNLYFVVPPLSEQIEISDFIQRYSEKNVSVQNKIEKQIEILLAYKKSLIHEVVTGKKQVV